MLVALQLVACPGASQSGLGPRPDHATKSAAYPHGKTSAHEIEDRRLESVLGTRVRTRSAHTMGRIIDVLADTSGNVEAAVIEFGGFLGIGTRKVAVQWSALRFEADAKPPDAIVEATRDQLRVVPEFEAGQPVVVLKVNPPVSGSPSPSRAAHRTHPRTSDAPVTTTPTIGRSRKGNHA